ncbi:MAG: hypothetical protein ACI9ZH_001130, partial [Paracoccaceae bacterium]
SGGPKSQTPNISRERLTSRGEPESCLWVLSLAKSASGKPAAVQFVVI